MQPKQKEKYKKKEGEKKTNLLCSMSSRRMTTDLIYETPTAATPLTPTPFPPWGTHTISLGACMPDQ